MATSSYSNRRRLNSQKKTAISCCSQKQSGLKVHKNVSYRPKEDVLRGDACETAEDNQRLHDIMRRYSMQVTKFMSRFLAPYAPHWTLDFATYRPLEEKGRDLADPQAQRSDAH